MSRPDDVAPLPARHGGFTLARRCVQSAFALVFAAAPFLAPEWFGGTAIALRIGPVDLLEPTSALSATVASGALATVAVLGTLPFVAASFAWGSVFCAWVCPFGFLSEGIDRLRHGRGARWSGRPWVTARVPRFAAVATLLLLSVLLGVPWVAVLAPPRLVSAVPIEALALAAIPWVTASLLAGVLAVELLARRRVVCRVLCPVGAGCALMRAPFTWRPRFAPDRCRCAGAPRCLTVCRWGLDPREMAATDGCTACLACVDHCPSGALEVRRRITSPHHQPGGTMKTILALTLIAALAALSPTAAPAQAKPTTPQQASPQKAVVADCVGCHSTETPTVVSDWKLSKHAGVDVSCDTCHGTAHTNASDVAKVALPTPDTCAQCHEERVTQYKRGKHALAWVAMNAMPTIHYQPMALIEGLKGCGGCHKIGLKTEADMQAIKKAGGASAGFGVASCDACHTRHLFSAAEARQPQACQTCHMGFDHPQWEMYSSSKHGVRSSLKQIGVLGKDAGAPTCQTCHMQEGNHEVRTAWGFLAVRLPMPEDKEWAADRVTILQALGVLDPQGKPTPRLEAVKAADLARLTQESFDLERKKMLDTCGQCHSANFAQSELQKGDDLIREADRLMAAAIREVAALYKDGVLKPTKGQLGAFPDLLTFDDAGTAMEKELFVMFLEHRMRAFQGAFHSNPDYALWYGYNEMKRSLSKIQEEAQRLRAHGPARPATPAKGTKPPATKRG